ncbi:hypothetical protein DRN50_08295, partial [Thermococci archaeon]
MKRKILSILTICLLLGLVNIEATTKILAADDSKSGDVISDGSYVGIGSSHYIAGDNTANKGIRCFLTFDLS